MVTEFGRTIPIKPKVVNFPQQRQKTDEKSDIDSVR